MSFLLPSRILGLGHFVPERRVENLELEEQLGLAPGWIESRTGIRARHWANPQDRLTDLAIKAGEMALRQSGLRRSEIGMVLLATSTPDRPLPPSAPLVAHGLGLKACGAIDLAGACSGFLYALVLADAFVCTQKKPVLIIAANILSRRIDFQNVETAVLFADAAGACVLGAANASGLGLLGMDFCSEGRFYDLLTIPVGGSEHPFDASTDPRLCLMHMSDGGVIFREAVRMMTQCSQTALDISGLKISDIDRFIPHQANGRLIKAVAGRIGCPEDKMVQTFQEFGNASAATIPLSLSLTYQQSPPVAGEHWLLSAAGAGMTGGSVVLAMV